MQGNGPQAKLSYGLFIATAMGLDIFAPRPLDGEPEIHFKDAR